jgi:hypothetical protein
LESLVKRPLLFRNGEANKLKEYRDMSTGNYEAGSLRALIERIGEASEPLPPHLRAEIDALAVTEYVVQSPELPKELVDTMQEIITSRDNDVDVALTENDVGTEEWAMRWLMTAYCEPRG